MNPRQTAQRLGLGRLALALWHQPLSRLRDSWRNGGPFVERETRRQHAEMTAAARHLPHLLDQGGNQVAIPMGTYHPAQPQPARHHDRQGHASRKDVSLGLDPNFIGLHLLQI